MFAISLVALVALSTYLFLSAEQLTELQAALHKDNYLFYWMLLVGFGAEVVAGINGDGIWCNLHHHIIDFECSSTYN
jgi:hypothetical protein